MAATKDIVDTTRMTEATAAAPAEALSRWMMTISRQHAAEMLQCSPQFLYQIASGRRKPPPALAFRIEDVVGIPARYWF